MNESSLDPDMIVALVEQTSIAVIEQAAPARPAYVSLIAEFTRLPAVDLAAGRLAS